MDDKSRGPSYGRTGSCRAGRQARARPCPCMNNVEAWGTESSREIGPHSKRPTHRWKINAARTQWHRLSLHGHGMGIMERFSHTVEGSRVNRASCNSIRLSAVDSLCRPQPKLPVVYGENFAAAGTLNGSASLRTEQWLWTDSAVRTKLQTVDARAPFVLRAHPQPSSSRCRASRGCGSPSSSPRPETHVGGGAGASRPAEA